LELSLLSFADLAVKLDGRRVSVTSRQEELPADACQVREESDQVVDLLALDGLIVRTMPVGSLEQVIFRMDALQAVEHAGVPILNPPRALEIAIDKWLTLERLSRAGIDTPPTWACQTRATAMEAFEALGGDVVVKPLFGGEGRGLVRLSDPDMAWRVFGTLQQLGNVLYVQQFIPNFGYDIRVLLVGQRCLSIKRRAAAGGWRTNISQGCSAEVHRLSAEEEQLAWSAARVTGGSLLGIDLLPASDGRTVVLEVNAVPGWKGTAAALGVDVADLVIEHLEELHVQRS
jgi:ribosomal protein S6--L-glutamate ligase